MSEMYEGVVFRSDEQTANDAFDALITRLHLRLVPLDSDLYGIYRVVSRTDIFDTPLAIEGLAEQVSAGSGKAAALFYDNRCGVRVGVLYCDGSRVREFGEGDEWWVPYDEDGELILDGPRLREFELLSELEYDCIFTAIDATLEAVGAAPSFDAEVIKMAFCYHNASVLAESGGSA